MPVIVAGMLTSARVADIAPLETARMQTFDAYQRLLPRPASERSPVAVIDIDEPSLAALGQWPWPRTLIAELIDETFDRGAAAMGFDVLFAEPDRTSIESLAAAKGPLAEVLAPHVNIISSNDEIMARAMSAVPVVLGFAVSPERTDADAKGMPGSSVAELGGDPRRFIPEVPGLIRNIPMLEASATGTGNFSPLPERDGIVRRVPLLLQHEGEYVRWLGTETLQAALGERTMAVRSGAGGVENFILAGQRIPVDEVGRMWVWFRPFDKALYFSAADVLAGNIPPDAFDERLVFVGTSAVGLEDLRTLPIGHNLPGVEVHAQTAEMIISGDFLSRPDFMDGAEMLVGAVMMLITVVLVALSGAKGAAIFILLAPAGIAAVSWWLFQSHRVLSDPIYPAVCAAVMFIVMATLAYLREEQRRAFVRTAFAQYLAPEMVDELLRSPDKLRLGGETRELTVMFADVRGFTAMTETLKAHPEQMTAVINILMTELTTVILANGGTVDKYMGDAVMAFWNAPIPDPDHRSNAARAALGMEIAVKSANAQIRQYLQSGGWPELPELRIGTGVATGVVTVGNVGSAQRFAYSIIGDAVNLAARLESQTKAYALTNLLSETAGIGVGPELRCAEVDLIKVKGKDEAVRIFTLLPAHIEWDEGIHCAILEAYRAGDAARLVTLIEAHTEHPVLGSYYRILQKRCEERGAANEPWSGVYIAQDK